MVKKNRTPLTKDILSELYKHKERTGVGPVALLYGRRKELPRGLSSSTINNWMLGDVQTARTDQLEAVLKLWRSLPDFVERPPKQRVPKLGEPGSGYVEITQDIRLKLVEYRDKRYIPAAIFNYFSDVPKGLTAYTISDWITGKTKFAKRNFLHIALDRCQAMEELRNRPVAITPEIIKKLHKYKKQTGLGPIGIINHNLCRDIPEGYSYAHHKNWLSGAAKTTQHDYLEFVLDLYQRILNDTLHH